MSYNRLNLHSLAIPQQSQSLTSRQPTSSRTRPIYLNPSQYTPYVPSSAEIPNVDNDEGYGTQRFKELCYKRDEIPMKSYIGKENINSDADDLFDNFDICFKAKFSANKSDTSSASRENDQLPVRRELLNEFIINGSNLTPCASGTKTPLAFANNSYFQRPNEFQVSKAGRYFDMKTPRNVSRVHARVKPKLNLDQNKEEDIENEDDEGIYIKLKHIVVTQNNINDNCGNAQKTVNKIRRECKEDRNVLDDVTNRTGQTYRGSVQEGGECERLSTIEMFTRRNTIGRETVIENQRRHSLAHNDGNDMRKTNFSHMFESIQKNQNLYPPSRNSINAKTSQIRMVERPSSVTRGGHEQKQGQPYVPIRRNSVKTGNTDTVRRGSTQAYDSFLRYFEKAKKEFMSNSARRSVSQKGK